MVHKAVNDRPISHDFVVLHLVVKEVLVELFSSKKPGRYQWVLVFCFQPSNRVLGGAVAAELPAPLLGGGNDDLRDRAIELFRTLPPVASVEFSIRVRQELQGLGDTFSNGFFSPVVVIVSTPWL